MSLQAAGSHSSLCCEPYPTHAQPSRAQSLSRHPTPLGDSYSGITDRWPGYCCLWYLLVNFCNQYNISLCSSWEWKPEAAHLILRLAPAPCSAAKPGGWPPWCSMIAAEVRRELARQVLMDGCSWWRALSIQREALIMMDHDCACKKACSLFVDLHSESWRMPCDSLEQVFGEKKKKNVMK